MKKILFFMLTICTIACLAVCGISFFLNTDEEQEEEKIIVNAGLPECSHVKRSIPVRVGKNVDDKFGKGLLAKHDESDEKPEFDLEDNEFKDLTEFQRAVMLQLRSALDSNDLKAVVAAVQKMREMGMREAKMAGRGSWVHYVPVAMRKAAVDSLGWFGSESLPEIVEFLADPDSDISQLAASQFEQAMQDPSFGDKDRAAVIKMVSSVLTDESMVDWMCMEINNMRHSVGIDTLLYMSENGTDAVRAKVPESMEFFTGEDSIKTHDDANNWLNENPDDSDDDELYGPIVSGN